MANITIIHNAKDPKYLLSRFKAVLGDHNISGIQLEEGFSKRIPASTDLVILGGGTNVRLKSASKLKNELFEYVKNLDLPLIGICFGAQVIARAYGANIVQLPTRANGVHAMRVIAERDMVEGRYILHAYKNQTWTLQDMPDDFKILAVSEEGIEMFRHQTKPIYGLQFHPEQFNNAASAGGLLGSIAGRLLGKKS